MKSKLDCQSEQSHAKAIEKAYSEYEIFNKTQQINSDFDKFIQDINKSELLDKEKVDIEDGKVDIESVLLENEKSKRVKFQK